MAWYERYDLRPNGDRHILSRLSLVCDSCVLRELRERLTPNRAHNDNHIAKII